MYYASGARPRKNASETASPSSVISPRETMIDNRRIWEVAVAGGDARAASPEGIPGF